MKKKLIPVFLICLLCFAAFAQNTLVYLEQGGAKQVVDNGGEIEVRSGGILDVQAGATFAPAAITLTGVDVGAPTMSAANVTANTLPRASIVQTANAAYDMPLEAWKTVPGAAPLSASTNTGDFSYGVIGTGVLGLTTFVADNAQETSVAALRFAIPPEYDAAETVQIKVTCKITNTATTPTIDFTAQEISATATLGSDLVTTAAQTVTTSFATYTFALTATDLVAGDILQIAMTADMTDPAGGTTSAFQVRNVQVTLDIKG